VIAAARRLEERKIPVVISVIGEPDPQNPQSVAPATIEQWRQEGFVEFQGRREDINAVWSESHIALLPSYREGMPKSLLEAAACARPMITADVPGCRELVRDGLNGLIVPPRDAGMLADAIERLAYDREGRLRMGAQARRDVEKYYSDAIVRDETSALYSRLLAST